MAFELLLAVPVLLICVLAVTQFGVFFANLQILSLACRAGAEAASESALPNAGGVPADVLAAIDQQLLSSGIQRCRVRVEHNVGGAPTVLLTGVCACEPHTNLPAPLPPGRYVRVSVCVPMSELTPNLLASFGFDVSCYTASCTTVMRYEL